MQDIVIASMPLEKNVPYPRNDWTPAICPRCGSRCWHNNCADDELNQMRSLGIKIVELCTECMLRTKI